MFTSISWSQYLTFWAVALAIYYPAVLLYYRRQPSFNSSISLQQQVNSELPVQDDFDEYSPGYMPEPSGEGPVVLERDFPPLAEALADEIEAFTSAIGKDAHKEELMVSLKIIMDKYKNLKGSDYAENIAALISDRCDENCSVRLTWDEISGLW